MSEDKENPIEYTASTFVPRVNLVKRVRIHEPVQLLPISLGTLPKRGARFWLLMTLVYLCVIRGIVYLLVAKEKVDIPAGLRSLSAGWIQFYGAGWMLAAIMIGLAAFNRKWWPPMFAAASAPAFVWSAAYFWTAIHTNDQSWNGAFIYNALTLIIFGACMVPPARGWSNR